MQLVVNQISGIVPACDQTLAHPKTSDKYKFISTRDILNKFAAYGWDVVKYKEAYTRKYSGYQTHRVDLYNSNDTGGVMKVGDSQLRIIIVNNHHASKAMTIKLGLFRLVCSNGLVVEDVGVEELKVRHFGANVDEQIAGFIEKIAVAAEKLRQKVAEYQAKTLTRDEMMLFAKSALETRFKPEQVTEEMTASVLQFRRPEDSNNDMWSVFNRVQENIVTGFNSPDRERAIRRITSVKRDLEVNQKLWSLMDNTMQKAA